MRSRANFNHKPASASAAKQYAKGHHFQQESQEYNFMPSKCVDADSDYDLCNEDTMTKPFFASKIRCEIDDEDTRKPFGEKKKKVVKESKENSDKKTVSKNLNTVLEIKKTNNEVIKPIPKIPYDRKVDQIMNKKPLRQRLSGLLPPNISLPISFEHQQLLKSMQLIDRTIQFLGCHRGIKVFFFDTLRKSIFESASTILQLSIIQKLLFLDPSCYNVEWKMNQKIKKYDIKISLPQKIQSMDLRKMQMRKKIVKFLLQEQTKLLIEKGITKIQQNIWYTKFDYKNVSIPLKSLPVHPNLESAELRSQPANELNKVQNPLLKSLLEKKKQKSQVHSMSQASVSDMIFSKVPASQISQKLLQMVRQKQKKHLVEIQQRKQRQDTIENEVLIKICREIMLIYMSKNVSNIFKMTLLELLKKRLSFKDTLIDMHVQCLLKHQSGFLKQIESSKKIKVVQINRQKFKLIEESILSNNEK